MLIADDEPSIALSTALILQDLGFEVETATHADEIVQLLRAGRASVLLQDVRMPGLDIDRHIAAIRAEPGLAGLRIVLFSAGIDLAAVAARLPVDAFLEKPFKLPELERLLAAPVRATSP